MCVQIIASAKLLMVITIVRYHHARHRLKQKGIDTLTI